MDLICFAAILAGLAVPLHWAVTAQFASWASPEYFRRYGVVIRRLEALDRRSEAIGTYRGSPIYGSVVFMGMEYTFARVVPPGHRARIDENELYLNPGLLYVFSRVSS